MIIKIKVAERNPSKENIKQKTNSEMSTKLGRLHIIPPKCFGGSLRVFMRSTRFRDISKTDIQIGKNAGPGLLRLPILKSDMQIAKKTPTVIQNRLPTVCLPIEILDMVTPHTHHV